MASKILIKRFLLLTTVVGRKKPEIFSLGFQRTMAEYSVNEINFDDLKDKVLKNKIKLIDVREPHELKNDGKIPNSTNIPLNNIVEAFQSRDSEFQAKYGITKPNQSTDILVISCRSGKRATDAFLKLQPLGYQKALVYRGSFQDWVQNGGPVEK